MPKPAFFKRYLGRALLGTLRAHGLEAWGLDLVDADYTGDVSEATAVAKATENCRRPASEPP